MPIYQGDFSSIFREDVGISNPRSPMSINVDTSKPKQLNAFNQAATKIAAAQASDQRKDARAEKIKNSAAAKAAKLESASIFVDSIELI